MMSNLFATEPIQTANSLFLLFALYYAHANDNEIDYWIDCLLHKKPPDLSRLLYIV